MPGLHSDSSSNVFDLFSGRPLHELDQHKVLRISAETDGICMLYSNNSNPEKLYTMSVLCWAIRQDGSVVGMVPWLNKLCPCTELQDPLNGHWEGYYDPELDDIFFEPPAHKIAELEMAVQYFQDQSYHRNSVVQEIADNIGTHAMLASDDFQSLTLTEVLSWRLYTDGSLSAMLIDQDKVTATPVLPGDSCLYPAESSCQFKYYFQHHIANQIKAEDPAALAAVALLIDS